MITVLLDQMFCNCDSNNVSKNKHTSNKKESYTIGKWVDFAKVCSQNTQRKRRNDDSSMLVENLCTMRKFVQLVHFFD